MATMIPAAPPPPGPGSVAETHLFEALRVGLPDDFWVYRNLHYVEERAGFEGEADFLVLHRELGMLVVECKGFGVKRSGRGEWIRLRHDGREEPLKRSPFEQANNHLRDLVRKLTRQAPAAQAFPFVHGYAVAFPMTVARNVDLPLDGPRELVIDADDLADIDAAVRRALGVWQKTARSRPAPLTGRQFKRFRNAVLHPCIDLAPRLGAQLAAENQAFVRLTEEQATVVEGWLENPRLRVIGGAGTGKTVLALEAARSLAESGASVLLLCFNKYLASFLEAQVEALDVTGGEICATSFHRLCARAYESLGRPIDVPEGRDAAAHFWCEEPPFVLLEALEEDKARRWDAIVVDEGQDFEPSWWAVLEESLQTPSEGSFVVFCDPAQNIFGRAISVPEAPTLRLTRNFRNTRAIGDVVSELGGVKMTPHPRCPRGTAPVVHEQGGPARTRRAVAELVKRLVDKESVRPDQIAVITPHSRKNSALAGVEDLKGVPLSSDPRNRSGAVLHATIGSFKGLESDVVIFADVDPSDPRCSRNARYVAASRARSLLHVFAKGDWMSSDSPD